MLALLRTFSWQDLRHHPWRSAAAVAAVMLGVALAFAVHVINASALDEFSQAVRAVNGQPDLEVRPMQGTLGEDLFAQIATHPDVARANPVLEATAMARPATQAPGAAPTALRLLGPMPCCCPPWPQPSCPGLGKAQRVMRCLPPPPFTSTPLRYSRWACRPRAASPAPRCNCKPACKP